MPEPRHPNVGSAPSGEAAPATDVAHGAVTGFIVQAVLLYAVFASFWILLSDKALGLLWSDPEQVLVASMLKGWFFVAVTALLLFVLMRRFARQVSAARPLPGDGPGQAGGAVATDPSADPTRSGMRGLWFPYIALAAAIVAAVVVAAWLTSRHHIDQDGERLHAIAQLKVGQVEAWLAERRSEARFMQTSVNLVELFSDWRSGNSGQARSRLVARLEDYRRIYGYRDVLVTGPDGEILLELDGRATKGPANLQDTVRKAMAEHRVRDTNFYVSQEQSRNVLLDFVIPVESGSDRIAIVLRVDPSDTLFASLRKWPLPSESAEVLLVREDGRGNLRPMMERRHPTPEGGPSVRRVTDGRSLAAQVLDPKNRSGQLLDGIDYRGVAVKGVGLAVPGTDWLLVAKIDRAEFEAPAVQAIGWIGFAGVLGMLVVSAALVLVHQRRTLQYSAALHERQTERLRALQLLDSIASSSTDAIFAKDLEGRYLLFNAAGRKLARAELGNVTGCTDVDIFGPQDAAALQAHDVKVISYGVVETFEEVLNTPNGTRDLQTTKGPLRDAAGRIVGIFGIARDVTDLRRAREALAEEAVRRRIMVEQSRDGIVMLNDDGAVQECNQRFADMLGYTVEEAQQLHLWDWDPNWPLERFQASLRDPNKGKYTIEVSHRRKDGSFVPVEIASTRVDWSGRMLTHCICRDITERKRAEQDLIESERRWVMALDSAGHGVWDWNPVAGHVYFSRQWKAILGYAEDEIGNSLEEWKGRVHPDDLPLCTAELQRHFDGETGGYRCEHRMRCKDGSYKWIVDQGMVVERDPQGKPLRVIGTHTDLTWRIAAEEKLRASEERYRSVVAALSEGVLLFGQDGRVHAANPAAARIMGIAQEKLLGMSALDPALLPIREDGRGFDADSIPVVQTLADGRARHETVMGWRDSTGELRWLLVNVEPIFGAVQGRPAAAAVSFFDITARRTSEMQLRKLSLAVEQSPNGIVITDADANIEYVNEAFEHISGYSSAELLDCNPRMLASGQTPAETFAAMWQTLVRGETWRGELVNRRKDGEIHTVATQIAPVRQADGRITHYLAIKEDVSEQKRLEAELDRHRHRLQELVAERTRQLEEANRMLSERSAETLDLYNKAPCGYHSLDASGRFLAINDTELAMLGYQREEVVGRLTFRDLLLPGVREQFDRNFPRLVAAGFVRDLEYEVIRKDGSTLPVMVSAIVVTDASGAMLYTRSTVFDNTERRAREREISALNTELTQRASEAEAASRAKSAFLANMSHEIRTPMNAILGLSHLLQRKVADVADRDKLDRITKAGRHLLSIINDVLDLSKIEAGKLSLETIDFDVEALMEDVCALVSERAGVKGLTLAVDIDPQLPRSLRGDRTRITQALLNYASNAVKFTEQGSVRLEVRVQTIVPGSIAVRFAVEDTGIGIEPEYHDRLFGAFEQADSSTTRRYGGSGLGLAITRRLATLMGGEVGLTSRPGEGSTFWFTARLAPALHAPIVVAHVTGDSGMPDETMQLQNRAGARVLLADDNEVNREVALELLAAVGLTADVARDGAEAVAMTRAAPYDLILMDVQMPVLDGLEATRAIRTLPGHGTTPIVAMTADAFAEDRDRCLAAGMDEHIAKPFDAGTFYSVLARRLPGRAEAALPAAAPPGRADDVPLDWRQRLGTHCGLNIEQGLRCVLGRWSKYVDLLHTYAESCEEDVARIRSHIAAGDNAGAKIRAHAMRGAASFVGADRVQSLAGKLEGALQDHKASAVVDGILHALDAERGCLEGMLAALPVAGEPVQATAAQVDIRAAQRVLQELEALVADDDVRANVVVHDAGVLLRGVYPVETERLEKAIGQFDYLAARSVLQALRIRIGQEPGAAAPERGLCAGP
jgi:two-component system sensor histidine kinase/response regulator